MAIEAETLWQHQLVPRHYICEEAELTEALKIYNAGKSQLPRILVSDSAAKALGAEVGQVLKVERLSPTAGVHYAYRLVVEE